MTALDPARHPDEGYSTDATMGTADIVFFVLAGVAPMGVVVALLVLSIARGNGVGVPGTYVIAGVILALFSIGFVRMSRRISDVGGFYSFARAGLGARAGGATAYVALVAYNAATIGIFGTVAYFGSEVFTALTGTPVPWQICAMTFFAIVAILAYFKVTLSAKVLGVALAAEVLALLSFDGAVLVRNGFHGFSFEVFSPSMVLGSGFGVSLMLAFGSFVGFEATALYSEEARRPHRTVPRATYISLAIISGFYLITTWAAISAYGADRAKAVAEANPQSFLFDAGTDYLGTAFTDLLQILVMTSLFAAFLAFHCNTARYHVALARDGLLPNSLARLHPTHGSPVRASAFQLTLLAATTLGFTLSGRDPYLDMGISLYGLGILGIVALQAIAAASIVGFFLRERRGESIGAAIVAPALGGLGLAAGLALMIANYPTLTGNTLLWVNSLPWSLLLAALTGAAVAAIRTHR
ncbi:APC family permease [Nocardia sp. CA-151230]|uniref:APC family permease n=1 Tax=Nocardia sp. CA-151230 TaxID=3239982 RepID=UPI003D936F58